MADCDRHDGDGEGDGDGDGNTQGLPSLQLGTRSPAIPRTLLARQDRSFCPVTPLALVTALMMIPVREAVEDGGYPQRSEMMVLRDRVGGRGRAEASKCEGRGGEGFFGGGGETEGGIVI